METEKHKKLLQLEYWLENIVKPEIQRMERFYIQWEKSFIEEKEKEMTEDV